MAAELVNAATSEKLAETDWTKNIEICELVAHDHRYVQCFHLLTFCCFFLFDECLKTSLREMNS